MNTEENKRIEFSLPANLVRALNTFLPTSYDVRYYINGIFLNTENELIATDGHRMFIIKLKQKEPLVKESIIFSIQGAIPKAASELKFLLGDEFGGWATCYKGIGPLTIKNKPKMLPVFYIDKSTKENGYVDYSRIINNLELEGKPTKKLGINANYLNIATKAAKEICPKFPTFQLIMQGETEPALIRITSPEIEDAKLIIMPCRI